MVLQCAVQGGGGRGNSDAPFSAGRVDRKRGCRPAAERRRIGGGTRALYEPVGNPGNEGSLLGPPPGTEFASWYTGPSHVLSGVSSDTLRSVGVPRYTYECGKCGHSFETLEGWDASTRKRCPECKSMAKRLLRPPAIVFKGSGFYATDHRSSRFSGSGDGNDGAESGSSAASDADSAKSGSGNGASADTQPKAKKAQSETKAAE